MTSDITCPGCGEEIHTFSNHMETCPYICRNCKRRKGTVNWVGENGILGHVHGWSQLWCERCCVKAQLEYAKKLAAQIPELEERLKKLR